MLDDVCSGNLENLTHRVLFYTKGFVPRDLENFFTSMLNLI